MDIIRTIDFLTLQTLLKILPNGNSIQSIHQISLPLDLFDPTTNQTLKRKSKKQSMFSRTQLENSFKNTKLHNKEWNTTYKEDEEHHLNWIFNNKMNEFYCTYDSLFHLQLHFQQLIHIFESKLQYLLITDLDQLSKKKHSLNFKTISVFLQS